MAYAPTNVSDDSTKDIFYDQLTAVVENVSAHNKLIVLGDMNASPPSCSRNGSESILGAFNTGPTNDNSVRLREAPLRTYQ